MQPCIRYSFGYILTVTGISSARSVGLDFRIAFRAEQDTNMRELHGSSTSWMILPVGKIKTAVAGNVVT